MTNAATASFKKATEILYTARQARIAENLWKARRAAQQAKVRFA